VGYGRPFLVLAPCLLVAAPARAEQTIGAISIDVATTGARASTCPDEPTFVAAVGRMMHRDVATTAGHVAVAIRAEPDRVEGSITMTEPGGTVTMQRKLHGKECRDVGEGLALVVALAIDPLADPSLPALPPPAKVPSPPPPPPRKPAAAPPPPPRAKEGTAFHVGPMAAARLTWGIQPVDAVELALGVEGAVQRGRWVPSARIDGGPAGTTSVAAGGGTVVFSGGEINALVCPAAFALSSLFTVLGACLSGGAAIVATRSIGYAVQHDTTSAVGYLGATVMLRARIAGPLGVVIEGGLRFPLESFEWDVQGYGAIGKTSEVVGTTAIGLDFLVR
jgi:hypothetical protein